MSWTGLEGAAMETIGGGDVRCTERNHGDRDNRGRDKQADYAEQKLFHCSSSQSAFYRELCITE